MTLLFAAFTTLLMLSCNEAAKSNKDSLSNDTIENKDSNEAPKNKEENVIVKESDEVQEQQQEAMVIPAGEWLEIPAVAPQG